MSDDLRFYVDGPPMAEAPKEIVERAKRLSSKGWTVVGVYFFPDGRIGAMCRRADGTMVNVQEPEQ